MSSKLFKVLAAGMVAALLPVAASAQSGSGSISGPVWSRNLLANDYYELLTAAPGNTGLYVGQPADRRSVGVTMRVALKAK